MSWGDIVMNAQKLASLEADDGVESLEDILTTSNPRLRSNFTLQDRPTPRQKTSPRAKNHTAKKTKQNGLNTKHKLTQPNTNCGISASSQSSSSNPRQVSSQDSGSGPVHDSGRATESNIKSLPQSRLKRPEKPRRHSASDITRQLKPCRKQTAMKRQSVIYKTGSAKHIPKLVNLDLDRNSIPDNSMMSLCRRLVSTPDDLIGRSKCKGQSKPKVNYFPNSNSNAIHRNMKHLCRNTNKSDEIIMASTTQHRNSSITSDRIVNSSSAENQPTVAAPTEHRRSSWRSNRDTNQARCVDTTPHRNMYRHLRFGREGPYIPPSCRYNHLSTCNIGDYKCTGSCDDAFVSPRLTAAQTAPMNPLECSEDPPKYNQCHTLAETLMNPINDYIGGLRKNLLSTRPKTYQWTPPRSSVPPQWCPKPKACKKPKPKPCSKQSSCVIKRDKNCTPKTGALPNISSCPTSKTHCPVSTDYRETHTKDFLQRRTPRVTRMTPCTHSLRHTTWADGSVCEEETPDSGNSYRNNTNAKINAKCQNHFQRNKPKHLNAMQIEKMRYKNSPKEPYTVKLPIPERSRKEVRYDDFLKQWLEDHPDKSKILNYMHGSEKNLLCSPMRVHFADQYNKKTSRSKERKRRETLRQMSREDQNIAPLFANKKEWLDKYFSYTRKFDLLSPKSPETSARCALCCKMLSSICKRNEYPQCPKTGNSFCSNLQPPMPGKRHDSLISWG